MIQILSGAGLKEEAWVKRQFSGGFFFEEVQESDDTILKGGPGSGHFNHSGRPGEVGGSLPAGLGKTIQQTDTEAFKAWFGNSKVVNDDGSPKVVYHGTSADFTEFDLDRLGMYSDHPSANLGFYFAEDVELANTFTGVSEGHWEGAEWIDQRAKPGSKVIPVYLKMENPYHMSAEDFASELDFWRGVKGATGYGYGAKYEDSAAHFLETRKWLIDNGYDGLIIDGSANTSYPELQRDNYIIWDPIQIKSAIGNRGTFDPNDPDITKEIVEKQLPIDDESKKRLIDIRRSIFNDDVDRLAERMYTGELSLGAWEETMKRYIRELHTSVAAIGKGGWDQMTWSDWGRLGTVMREQYRYLHGFAEAIAENRETISINAVKARAHLYGTAAGHSAYLMEAGADIVSQLPWMPKDGSTECLVGCKCQWDLKKVGVEKNMQLVQATWKLNPAEHCKTCVERKGYVTVIRVPKDAIVPNKIGGY